MSEHEKLRKVKIKESQEKYLKYANLVFQEFCDEIELDMNDVNTVECKFGVKPKKKIKPDKKSKVEN